MTASVSADGQVQLPPELRQPLTLAQCAALLEGSRSLPGTGPADEAAVAETIREARARRA